MLLFKGAKKNIFGISLLIILIIYFSVLIFSKKTSAYATGPVVLGTQPATNITTTSAVLNGIVTNTRGEIPTYIKFMLSTDQQSWTDFPLNPAYLLMAPDTDGNPYSIDTSMATSPVNNLTSNTLYYYKACAMNSAGSSCSNLPLRTFTTSNPNSSGNNNGSSNTGTSYNTTTQSTISNVITHDFTNLTDTSVKLNGEGTVSAPDYAYFRYSKVDPNPPIFCNDLYGSSMSSKKATFPNSDGSYTSANSGTIFSTGINGLEPDTTYYYCAVVSNSANSSGFGRPNTEIKYGGVKTFKTKCGTTCTTIETKNPSSITKDSVYLNGSFNSTQATKTWFEYEIDPASLPQGSPTPVWQTVNVENHTAQSVGNNNRIQFQVTGLTPNTSYIYKAVAQTDWGTLGNPNPQNYYGIDMSFTTNPPDSTPDTPTDPGTTQDPNSGYDSGGPSYDNGGGAPSACSSLTIKPISNKTIYAGHNLSFAVHTCGANGETVTYQITNIPPLAIFNSNGMFVWNTNFSQTGIYDVTFDASTPSGNNASPVTVRITVTPPNTNCPSLTIEPIEDQEFITDQYNTFYANICGNFGQQVTYSIANLPTGAGILPNGLFVWVPTADQVGQHQIFVNAVSGTQTVSLTVNVNVTLTQNGPNPNGNPNGDPNGGPNGGNTNNCPNFIIRPISDKHTQAGSPISFTAHTCGNQGKPVTYSITSTLMPGGAGIGPANGRFSWSTGGNQAGSYDITIHAKAPIGALDLITNTQAMVDATPITVHITVTPIPISCGTLTINSLHNEHFYVDQIDTFNVTVCGNHGEQVTYSPENIPSGATLDPSTGLFTWTPTSSDLGLHAILIGAKTSTQRMVTASMSINVTDRSGNSNNQGDPNTGRTCPTTSTGVWPRCVDNATGVGFCDTGSTGTYPNCVVTNTGGSGSGNGNSNGGNGTFGNGNNGNGGNGNGPTVLGSANNPAPAIGSFLVPPSMDLVHYHEGVEHVLTRQIMGDIALAKIYGYQDGQNLLVFAQNLAHTFATMFGYYQGGGREIRVTVPDIAAYQLGLKDGMLAVYEYYDNHLTGVATATGSIRDIFEYEYYFH
ncbi:MAG: putative Ig domain-containing protein [Candidatus Nomurabacteria bacterium]|nr:putative Ig domain-containing protein [Candidatus Nomurabacteria bacterium]